MQAGHFEIRTASSELGDYAQLMALNEVSQRLLQIRSEDELCAVAPQLLADSLQFRLAFLNLEEDHKLILRGFHVLGPSAGFGFIAAGRFLGMYLDFGAGFGFIAAR